MPTKTIRGLSTIRWGAGAVANNDLAGAVVLRAGIRTRDGKYFEIADTDGFTKAVVGLDDGDTLELECLDDTAITWPAFMDYVELEIPDRTGVLKLINKSKNLNLERSADGKRNLTLEYYVGVQADT